MFKILANVSMFPLKFVFCVWAEILVKSHPVRLHSEEDGRSEHFPFQLSLLCPHLASRLKWIACDFHHTSPGNHLTRARAWSCFHQLLFTAIFRFHAFLGTMEIWSVKILFDYFVALGEQLCHNTRMTLWWDELVRNCIFWVFIPLLSTLCVPSCLKRTSHLHYVPGS